MIMYRQHQSPFKQDVLRTRGWHSIHGLGRRAGLGQSLPNLSPGQWYELIALAENQPLADVQTYYSQTATGSNVTNLDVALGQWPGGIAHTGYLQYQSGGVVDAPGSGHYFKYGGGYVSWAQTNSRNQWAVPSQLPTAQQVATQQAASTAQLASPSTSVQASNQQSVSPQSPGVLIGSQGTTTTGADWIPGIPNVALLIAGGAAVVFMVARR